MINRPRYIGFLLKLNTPSVTNFDAVSGFNGLIVVRFFLKEETAVIITIRPKIIKPMPVNDS